MTTSLSIAEILLFIKKMVENCYRQHCQWMRNAYFRTVNIDVSVKRLHNFCINKNKMVISRKDRMSIKV